MAGPEPVNTVARPGPGAMAIVSKTFIQAKSPRVKVFFIIFMGSAPGGTTGMAFAFLMACDMNFFSCWFSGKIVLKMSGVRQE